MRVLLLLSNLDTAVRGLAGLNISKSGSNGIISQCAILYIDLSEIHLLLSVVTRDLGCADVGRWFCAANLAVFSLIVAESIVFCLLKLLLLFHS